MKFRLIASNPFKKVAATLVKKQSHLIDLPNELIAQILEYIDDVATLRHLARTCRRMQDVGEALLYQRILTRSGDSTLAILNAFHSRPGRASAVQYLDIPCDSRVRHNFNAIAGVITSASYVREIMIESPGCSSSAFEKRRAWNQMADHLFRPFQWAVGEGEVSIRPLQSLTKRTF